MITAVLGAWGWVSSKFLHISIWIGVAVAVIWNIYIAGMNKQKINQAAKEARDETERNKIGTSIDATPDDINRQRLRDRWSTK